MNKNLQRTYRKVLYSLKRQYGDEITVCQHVTSSTNYQTGAKSYTCSRTQITRAILLPTEFARKTDYRLPMISANKMFVFGGTFDVGSKIIIIDTQDVPTYFELSHDDWILIDNTRYEIDAIERLDHQAGWVIGAKQIPGATADLEVALTASDSLSVTGNGTAVRDRARTITDSLSITDLGSAVKE